MQGCYQLFWLFLIFYGGPDVSHWDEGLSPLVLFADLASSAAAACHVRKPLKPCSTFCSATTL